MQDKKFYLFVKTQVKHIGKQLVVICHAEMFLRSIFTAFYLLVRMGH